MIGDDHALTPGYVVRHIPPASNLGLDIAILDIAQDFLLGHLAERGVFDGIVVFKGGTALRKLFAGSEGRFSTDLDFASAHPQIESSAAADLIAETADVSLGPFRFRPVRSRGRWKIGVSSPFGDPPVSMKLDVGPPCWLQAERRHFVPTPVHRRYGFELPRIPSMRLTEVLAEKVARLTRSSTARDAWDLVWAASTSPHSRFSSTLLRRLAVLKVWVDNHGLRPRWERALAPASFDANTWLAPRDPWDDEQIGLLAHPPPSIETLEVDLARYYSWLVDLSEDEARWSEADARHRGEVIAAIRQLDVGALSDIEIW